jgi:hypothetical protein
MGLGLGLELARVPEAAEIIWVFHTIILKIGNT